MKQKLYEASSLALPYFDELFGMECVTSEVGIEAILTQLRKPLAYFS